MSDTFFRKSGSLNPDELARVQGIFDRACARFNLPADSDAAKEAAVQLMDLYQHGIRDEEMLLAMLRN